MKPSIVILLTVIPLLLVSCGEGLTPPDIDPGIAGTITVSSAAPWPPRDSVQGLWLFASLVYPLDSTKVITGVLIEPRTIYLYPSLGEPLRYGVDTVAFQFALPPGTYRYIGVIQQLRPDLLIQNFRVVAMLGEPSTPNVPRSITVERGRQVGGLHLVIDFSAPPPQPFEAAE